MVKRNALTWLIPLVILIFAVAFISGCAPKEKEGVVKVGVIAPLTGSGATWGINDKRGIDLIFKDLNLSGKVELIYEDTQCDPSKGVTAVQKLLNIDKVDFIIGSVCSSVTLAAAPIMEQNKKTLISACASSPKISEAGDYIFRTWPSDEVSGGYIAEYASNVLKIEKVALLTVNNEYGVGLREIFKERFKGEVVADETFNQDDTDFRTYLTKIKRSNPDALFFVSSPEQVPTLLKQIKELGMDNVQLLTNEGMLPNEEDLPEGSNGIIFARPKFYNKESFVKKYMEKYGEAPGVCSSTGYDSLAVLMKAINNVGTDVEKVKNYLYSIKDFDGASGRFSFDKNGDPIFEGEIVKVDNGKFKIIK